MFIEERLVSIWWHVEYGEWRRLGQKHWRVAGVEFSESNAIFRGKLRENTRIGRGAFSTGPKRGERIHLLHGHVPKYPAGTRGKRRRERHYRQEVHCWTRTTRQRFDYWIYKIWSGKTNFFRHFQAQFDLKTLATATENAFDPDSWTFQPADTDRPRSCRFRTSTKPIRTTWTKWTEWNRRKRRTNSS